MMQKQKGFSAPVLALSVWTAALAEEMQTGISPRGMIIHGAVQALLLTCISGVFSACWQRAAMQWVWLFSAGAWFLAELFGTVMQAQNICQQEFRSMALIGLLPLLLWAGWCIPPSGWDATRRYGRLPPASDSDTNILKTCSNQSTDDTAPGTLRPLLLSEPCKGGAPTTTPR